MAGLNTLRPQLRAAAVGATDGATYTLATADAVLGVDMLANANTFLPTTLAATKVYLTIYPGKLTEDNWGGSTVNTGLEARLYTIPFAVYFGFTRTTDQTWATEEAFLEALRTRWKTLANFTGTMAALTVTFEGPEFFLKDVPGHARHNGEVTMIGCG